jgi:hypothetical protein
MKRDVYSIAHCRLSKLKKRGTHQHELMWIRRLETRLGCSVRLIKCRRKKPWFLSALLPLLGCVGYGKFHLGPHSPHGDFFALKGANSAFSPRKEPNEFSALFIGDNSGDFW